MGGHFNHPYTTWFSKPNWHNGNLLFKKFSWAFSLGNLLFMPMNGKPMVVDSYKLGFTRLTPSENTLRCNQNDRTQKSIWKSIHCVSKIPWVTWVLWQTNWLSLDFCHKDLNSFILLAYNNLIFERWIFKLINSINKWFFKILKLAIQCTFQYLVITIFLNHLL
jgi:hypothetical protein